MGNSRSAYRSAGSVRVNLSIPAEQDVVLSELARITGRAKASFAAEALTWYLPQLLELLQAVKDQRASSSTAGL